MLKIRQHIGVWFIVVWLTFLLIADGYILLARAYLNFGYVSFVSITTNSVQVNNTSNAFQDDLQGALQLVLKARSFEDLPEVTIAYARILEWNGEWQRATRELETVWALNPSVRTAFVAMELVRNFERLGETEKSNEVLYAVPIVSSYLYSVAESQIEKEEWIEASATARRVDSFGDVSKYQSLRVFRALCLELRATDLQEEAVYWCERYNQLVNNTSSQIALARALIVNERYVDAVNVLEKTVIYDEESAPAWNYLGNAKEGLGAIEDAIFAYQKSIVLDPQYPFGRLSLADLYAKLGRTEEARQEYMNLRGIVPDEWVEERLKRLE